jgi:hypothetical protein
MAMQPASAAQWARIIRDWEASGLTHADFCHDRGLSLGSFRYWRYKLDRSNGLKRLDRATDGLGRPLHDGAGPQFVPVRLTAPAPEASIAPRPIEVLLAAGQRVAVSPGFDSQTLQQVVAALEDRSC